MEDVTNPGSCPFILFYVGYPCPEVLRCIGTVHSVRWPYKMGPVGCPETSLRNYQSTLRKIPKERRFQLLRDGRLQSHVFLSPLTFCHIGTFSFVTRPVQLIFIYLQHHIPNFPGISDLVTEVSKFQHHTSYAPNVALYWFLLNIM